jgi:hypothetical protein
MGNPLRIVLFVLSSLMLLACSTSVRTQPGMLRIEPVDLFAGEDKKFKPFLGVMSGAVKVSYEGKKEAIRAVFEVWENGVGTKTGKTFGELTRASNRSRYYDGQFLISVTEPDGNRAGSSRYVITAAFVDDKGHASYRTELAADQKHTASGLIQLHDSVEVSEQEEAAVWGMQATDEGVLYVMDFSPERLKQAKWALVVKLSAVDEE